MAKNKYTRGTTAVGEIYFAHVHKTEVYKDSDTGKFSVMLKLSEADTEKLLAAIEEDFEAYKGSPAVEGKKFLKDYSNGYKEYKEEGYFKFTMREEIKCKSGEVLHKSVPIYDAKLNEISGTITEIGNGTKAKVAYELYPFWMNAKNNGVSLRIVGIQIIKLEKGGMSAEGMGFDSVDGGYVAEEDEKVSYDNEEGFEAIEDTEEESDF